MSNLHWLLGLLGVGVMLSSYIIDWINSLKLPIPFLHAVPSSQSVLAGTLILVFALGLWIGQIIGRAGIDQKECQETS